MQPQTRCYIHSFTLDHMLYSFIQSVQGFVLLTFGLWVAHLQMGIRRLTLRDWSGGLREKYKQEASMEHGTRAKRTFHGKLPSVDFLIL